MDFETKLQNFGLSEKEAKVYVALLELGESPASDIARESGVKRATTYVVLDSLKEMGLLSTYDQRGTTQYVASNPSRLQNIVENKKEEWVQKSDKLDSLLPELQSLHNVEASKPTIRFFEGKDGLLESYKEFLSDSSIKDKSVKYFYSPEKINQAIDGESRKEFIKLREKKELGEERICSYSEKSDQKSDSSADIIDDKKFPISIDLEIYGDNVFISTLEDDLSAILIKNQDIADSFKTLFRLAQIGARAEQEREDGEE